MEDDSAHLWFYTCKGQRFGPVPTEELRERVARAELDPIADLVWHKGLPNWKPLGEVRSLYVRADGTSIPESAAAPAPASALPLQAPAPIPSTKHQAFEPAPTPPPAKTSAEVLWPGARRRSYWFMTLIFPGLWMAGYSKIHAALGESLSEAMLAWLPLAAALVPLLLVLVYTLMRFSNLGMSRWWILGKFVPLLQLWVDYRLLACPAGYATHRKLDVPGILIAITYWLFVLIGLALVVAIIALVVMIATDPEFAQAIRNAVTSNPQLLELYDAFTGALPPAEPTPAP